MQMQMQIGGKEIHSFNRRESNLELLLLSMQNSVSTVHVYIPSIEMIIIYNNIVCGVDERTIVGIFQFMKWYMH